MSQQNSQSPLDKPEIQEFLTKLLASGETATNAARIVQRSYGIKTSERAVRRFRERHQIRFNEPVHTLIDGDTAECSTPVDESADELPELPSPEDMMRERGLDPEEWFIQSHGSNMWQGPSQSGTKWYRQTKFTAKRKQPEGGLLPARTDGWYAPPKAKKTRSKTEPRLVVVVGDLQAPFYDQHLVDLFNQWLAANEPDEGVLLGDTVDFPDISRHKFDPENNALVNECIQAGYDVLRGFVDSSPNTEWQKLIGNHDQRIRDYVVEYARSLYGVSRAALPGEEREAVLTVPYLLRLDELGIETVDCRGSYEDAQIQLSPYLAVRHGWIAVKGSGASALRTLEHLGYSCIIGHTHRQSLVYQTTYDIDGSSTVLAGAEAGCMCRLSPSHPDGRRWPSYTVNPNWQQGFLTANIYPDGKFRLDHATYAANSLFWRDQRYE